jgi:triosephosphate isomerase
MLRDLGVTHVLAGHSERRHVIGEDDLLVSRKVRAALDEELVVTLCVGETLAQREQGQTLAINRSQLVAGLEGVSPGELGRLTVAYEPVWAIGTGRTATPQDAQAVHKALRATVAGMYGPAEAAALRIQYGGSVKPGNAAELFAEDDLDGGLIGGASLEAESFAAIVQAAASAFAT